MKQPTMRAHMSSRLCLTATLCAVAVLAACTTTAPASAPKAETPIAEVERFLTGYFTSAAQAAVDKDFFNIELRIVPIWSDRKDGPWLYVEQADARTPEKPYRQRLYRLETRGDQVLSHIYTLTGDPQRFAGEWKKPQPMGQAKLSDVELKDGCAVFMTRTPANLYTGATAPNACPSELRGSKYASAKVNVSANLLESWDQGFDANDKQVWGSTKGAYKFVKLSAKP